MTTPNHPTPSVAAGSELPINSTPEYENALKLYGPIIETMKVAGFGLMLDGETFYQFGNELAPRERITFDMHQAYAIHSAVAQAERRGIQRMAERLRQFKMQEKIDNKWESIVYLESIESALAIIMGEKQ